MPKDEKITERKKAEEALREKEEIYGKLFNSMTDTVFIHELVRMRPGKFLKRSPKLLMPTALIILLILPFSLCLTSPDEEIEEKELTIYVGSCMGDAVSEITDKFEAENPEVEVKIIAKGSRELLDNIRWRSDGDIFMPGEESFAKQAVDKNYMDTYTLIAYHSLAVIVPDGNAKGIKSLKDITDDNIRVAVGDSGTAMERMMLELIGETPIFGEIRDNYVYLRNSKCSRIPEAVAEKQADVGISCNASALRVKGVHAIDIPEFSNNFKIPIGVLKFSKDEELAQSFVEFVKSDTGRDIMEKHGFGPI